MNNNFYEMQSFALDLFKALDDVVLNQYYNYRKHDGEYPSEASVKALERGLNYHGFGPSQALNKMLDNLVEDLKKGIA